MSLSSRLKLTSLILLLFSCVFLFYPDKASAANVYSNNFETDVSIPQWSICTTFFVSPTHGNCITSGASSNFIPFSPLSPITTGYIDFYTQIHDVGTTDSYVAGLAFWPAGYGLIFWNNHSTGKWELRNYDTTTVLFSNLAYDTPYHIIMDFDAVLHRMRASVDGGVTFSSWVDGPTSATTQLFFNNYRNPSIDIDDFNVYDTAFSVVPPEYFAKITNAPDGIGNMYMNASTNELVKTFPNDWILKVFSDTLTPDGWIKVQDMTDESFGYMQGGFERLPYDETKQEEFENDSSVILTTKSERAAKIVDVVNHYYSDMTKNKSLYSSDDNNTKLSLFKSKGFPTKLLLAIIAQESGGINYDNEFITNDFGHGITQATMKNYLSPRSSDFDHRGEFSHVVLSKCPLNNLDQYESCYDPKNIALIWNEKMKVKELGIASYKYTPLGYHDYEYNPHNVFDYRVLLESEKNKNNLNNPKFKQYTNTSQSIFSNIKDGFGVLSDRYGNVWFHPCSENVVFGGYTFTCSEISIIKAVWGYNGATTDSPDYLSAVSKKLNTLTSYFNIEPYLNDDNLIEKLTYAGKHRAELKKHSPIDITIKDSHGNVVGVENGEVKADIDNSGYDPESERAVVFFPNDKYTYEVVGDATGGTYGIDINIFNGSETPLTFNAFDLSIIPGEIHSYQVDATKLTNNAPDAVTVSIDKEGDGIVDEVLYTGSSLTDITDTIPPELKLTFNLTTKDVELSGVDNQGIKPVVVSNGQNTTITDISSNTTIIPFTKYKEIPTRLRLSYNKIIRNGVTTIVPNTNIVYDWQEKKGVLTDLDTRITIKGVEKYIFNYKKGANITTIKEKTQNGMKIFTKQGFVPVTMITNQSELDISY